MTTKPQNRKSLHPKGRPCRHGAGPQPAWILNVCMVAGFAWSFSIFLEKKEYRCKVVNTIEGNRKIGGPKVQTMQPCRFLASMRVSGLHPPCTIPILGADFCPKSDTKPPKRLNTVGAAL
jgi:hypothetical protein